MTRSRGLLPQGGSPAHRAHARATLATAVLVAIIAAGTAACGAGQNLPAVAASPSTQSAPTTTVVPVPVTPTPSPTPSAVEGPLVMAESLPLRLVIPAIGVDSDLMELGLLEDGSLEVPPGGFPAGWYDGGPTPGELGPAVIAGHVDWVTGPGVFYDLGRLAVDDGVQVTRADGSVADFRVTAVAEYPKDEFPTDLVYGDVDHAGLRLITCGGAWNPATQHYEDNTVVYAELVDPRAPAAP